MAMTLPACSEHRVSVLIPAFQAEATIQRAVRSALAQPEASEVVVVDDGSMDQTAQAADRCDDGSGRLRIIRQANHGPAQAANHAFELSSAPYACVLDADDFMLPNRLGALFGRLGGEWDFAADRLLLAVEGQENGPYEPWRMRLPPSRQLSFEDFVRGNVSDSTQPRTELGFLQPAFRRAFLNDHALRHDETLRLGEDYLLYATALACGARFYVTEDYGYVAVQRAGSLSHNHRASDLEALLRADEKLAEHPGLTERDRAALKGHIANTRRRWIYHLALEAKSRGDLPGALGTVLGNLDTFGYVVAQTVRAKIGAYRPQAARAAPP
jgi:succinoglycan biosynthesis protein ExoU